MRVQVFGFRVSGFGFRVQGSRLRVWCVGLPSAVTISKAVTVSCVSPKMCEFVSCG